MTRKKMTKSEQEERAFNSVNTFDLPSGEESSEPLISQIPSDGKRTLEVVTCTGTIFTIEIDPKWKVTFGRLQEGMQSYTGNQAKEHGNGLALRIYETKERQLACFRDVESFRDTAIPMDVVFAPKKKYKGQEKEEVVHDKNVGSLLAF